MKGLISCVNILLIPTVIIQIILDDNISNHKMHKMIFVQNFTIKNRSRLDEFIQFKNNNLPKTELRHEPDFNPSDGSYKVSIRSTVDDVVCLEDLFEKWNIEDQNTEVKDHDPSLFSRLVERLRA